MSNNPLKNSAPFSPYFRNKLAFFVGRKNSSIESTLCRHISNRKNSKVKKIWTCFNPERINYVYAMLDTEDGELILTIGYYSDKVYKWLCIN